jgi:hypothetical protein
MCQRRQVLAPTCSVERPIAAAARDRTWLPSAHHPFYGAPVNDTKRRSMTVTAEPRYIMGTLTRVRLTGAPQRLIPPLLLLLASSCGGRDEPDPDRQALFETVTRGSVQHDHPCANARVAEWSASNGLIPESALEALRIRIAQADLATVQGCLAQVQEYDQCFLDLPCDSFAESMVPAWLLGSNAAPCACGVVFMPFAGPLPTNLATCTGILPILVAPPGPGVGCPE